jgi:hypothetical protein
LGWENPEDQFDAQSSHCIYLGILAPHLKVPGSWYPVASGFFYQVIVLKEHQVILVLGDATGFQAPRMHA